MLFEKIIFKLPAATQGNNRNPLTPCLDIDAELTQRSLLQGAIATG
jgi:hypothetical protein